MSDEHEWCYTHRRERPCGACAAKKGAETDRFAAEADHQALLTRLTRAEALLAESASRMEMLVTANSASTKALCETVREFLAEGGAHAE